MTEAEFLQESLSFDVGKITVVSGPDFDTVWTLINQAKDFIETNSSKLVLCYDSRGTTVYDHRDNPFRQNVEEGYVFEYISLLAAENDLVVLVANQFDRESRDQNREPKDVIIDTMLDLFHRSNIAAIPGTASRRSIAREMFEFLSRVYYYDTRAFDITFIKTQEAVRPP